MFEASVQQNKNKKHMKNFEAQTAKELLFKIEFFYSDFDKSNKVYIMDTVRAFVDTAQVLFNLQGYSISEVIDELKKISGTI